MDGIRLEETTKVYPNGVKAIDNVTLDIRAGEFMVLVGPSGMRQVDPPAHDRRSRGGHRGPDPDRRPGRHRPTTARPRHRDGVPELRALPPDDGGGEPRLRAQAAPRVEGGAQVPGRSGGGHARPEGVAETAARIPLGRPASASGDGAGDGAGAEGVPHGRAALEPRRKAPRRDEGRAHPAARPARCDDRLRHPRPGRGDDARPAGRRDARRRPAAVRHAAEAVPSAGEPLRGGIHGLTGDERRRSRGGRRAGPLRRAHRAARPGVTSCRRQP